MKPIDIRDDPYVEYNEDFNKKDPKFKYIGTRIQFDSK